MCQLFPLFSSPLAVGLGNIPTNCSSVDPICLMQKELSKQNILHFILILIVFVCYKNKLFHFTRGCVVVL